MKYQRKGIAFALLLKVVTVVGGVGELSFENHGLLVMSLVFKCSSAIDD